MDLADFTGKFAWLKRLFWWALPGAFLVVLGIVIEMKALVVVGILMIVPLFVFAYVLTFLHWKHRYVGSSSTLWGVLLAIETSGWFKLVYVFRHIIPDLCGSGRYSREKAPSQLPGSTGGHEA